MNSKHFLASTLFILFLNVINGQSPKDNRIYKETKKANDYSLDGHILKKSDQIISVYTDKTILLPLGNIKPISGLKNIKSFYEKGFLNGSSLKITTENISYTVIDENNANEVGKYYILYKPTDSKETIEISGYMLITWQKNKMGQWKILYDMWH